MHADLRPTDRVYQFAEFELDTASGELRRGETIVTLQEKPLLLLIALLDHPQRVVTREQLRAYMWDSRTVVEYDQGINAAIRKVRDALGDAADSPRIVETVAKRGYRMLVPVTVRGEEAAADGIQPPAASMSAIPASMTSAAPEAHAAARQPLRRRLALLLTALGIALAGSWWLATQYQSARATQIHSIAVLPLLDLSPGGGSEYFADGITEEITTNLAQILPQRVISRTSVMRFKRTEKPITVIARELGVEAIVEGSIARDGDRVSVTVQLIDAIEDRHLWAEKYQRRVEDILALEAELSQAIASQVSGTLGRQRAPARTVRRVNPRVHELCLLGRYHWNKRTAADLARAETYFQEAIRLDPRHAPAHAGLADVYAMQPFYGATTFNDTSAKALAAAHRALQLDETLAEAHATLGLLRVSTRDWPRSAIEFRRALELNPNYATAHHWYSYYLRFANRLDEACAELEIARQLDPLSAIISADQGEVLNAARRYDEARVSLRRAMELAPAMGRPHALMSVTELATGRSVEALRSAGAALSLDPSNPAILAQAGFTYAVTGDTARATQLLATLKTMAVQDINVSMYAAMIEAGLGQNEQALASLEAQVRSPHSAVLQGIQHWYAFQSLLNEPRFRQVLAQGY